MSSDGLAPIETQQVKKETKATPRNDAGGDDAPTTKTTPAAPAAAAAAAPTSKSTASAEAAAAEAAAAARAKAKAKAKLSLAAKRKAAAAAAADLSRFVTPKRMASLNATAILAAQHWSNERGAAIFSIFTEFSF